MCVKYIKLYELERSEKKLDRRMGGGGGGDSFIRSLTSQPFSFSDSFHFCVMDDYSSRQSTAQHSVNTVLELLKGK